MLKRKTCWHNCYLVICTRARLKYQYIWRNVVFEHKEKGKRTIKSQSYKSSSAGFRCMLWAYNIEMTWFVFHRVVCRGTLEGITKWLLCILTSFQVLRAPESWSKYTHLYTHLCPWSYALVHNMPNPLPSMRDIIYECSLTCMALHLWQAWWLDCSWHQFLDHWSCHVVAQRQLSKLLKKEVNYVKLLLNVLWKLS